MRITKYHRLNAAAKWDWNTSSWFPVVNVILEDKCIHARMIRRGQVARNEALAAADEVIKDAKETGILAI